MNPPTVSLIVPIYKAEAFLPRFLSCALEQSYPRIQFVFIDDGSPDDSIGLLERTVAQHYPSLKERVTILRQANSGPLAARMAGIRAATGEYILCADADDWMRRNMVEKMVKAAMKEDADIVVCNFYRAYKYYNLPNWEKHCSSRSKQLQSIFAERSAFGYLWNKMVRKTLWEHPQLHLPPCNMQEDLMLMAQFYFLAHKVRFIRPHLYYYRRDNPSSITNKNPLELDVAIARNRLDLYHNWRNKGLFEGFETEFLRQTARYVQRTGNEELAQILRSEGISMGD